MILSFLLCLGIFFSIGLSSLRKATGSKQDYYLASQGVAPWLVGLSAVATNNSGYMFIGVIGYTYTTGLASVWLMLGWIFGDFLASMVVHRRLRDAAEETGEMSYVGVLNHWGGAPSVAWQRFGGALSILLLLAYAGAQFVAGGKALQVLFDWPAWAGAVIGAVIVSLYCMAGGIRASIWTDAAQSLVMIVAMGLLLLAATNALGGPLAAVDAMAQVDGFLDWFPRDLAFPGLTGGLVFALSWMFAGLSVIGQPHIMVRFMTLSDSSSMLRARVCYYLWFTAFYAMATGVGLLARVYLSDPAAFDAELALPTMAVELLPPYLVGLILAGIFAATMSTADSLVLSCSAALTHDLLPTRVEHTALLKLATLALTAVALLWALFNSQSVFALVILAWSGLASAFAPVLLIRVCGGRPSGWLMLAMSGAGLGAALAWRGAGLQGAVYEGMAGILVGLGVFLIGHLLAPARAKATPSER